MFKLFLSQNPCQHTILLNPNLQTVADYLEGSQLEYVHAKINAPGDGFVGMLLGKTGLVFVAIAVRNDQSESDWIEKLRQTAAKLSPLINTEKIAEAGLVSALSAAETLAFVEGIVLSNYQFLDFKKDADKTRNTLCTLYIQNTEVLQADLARLEALCHIVYQTRNVVNMPPYILNAKAFVEYAQKMTEGTSIRVEVWDQQRIEAENMVGILAVNRGSHEPPAFLILEYTPENAINDQPVVLVGKGVLFDTGGYSLKPYDKMVNMKVDMSGGAAVVGALCAAARNQLPIKATALVPLVENRISHNAFTVDEIIRYPNGVSVEVQNTDAEGRLILADALIYAQKLNPMLTIDIATLTGASGMLTGSFGMTMNAKQAEPYRTQLIESGAAVYERIIELPLWSEYGELLKSAIADVRNIGGPIGGMITAAKFLEHFVNYPWIHLDIAGMCVLEKADGYRTQGGTGVGVRILYHFLETLQKSQPDAKK